MELDPNNHPANQDYGYILYRAGRYAESIEAYNKCLAVAPSDAGCNRELAFMEYVLGNYEAASEALSFTERLNSGAGTQIWAAYGYGLLGLPEDAQRAFDRLTELAEDVYVDPGQWARTYMGVGNYDEALRQINRAIANPDLIRRHEMIDRIMINEWSDPLLESPEWIEARNQLAYH